MKIGVSITAFNEPYIEAVINHFKPYVDDIVVAVSTKPWFGNHKPDDTYERAKKTGVLVERGYWEHEHDQRNFTNSLLDVDYILMSHGDTFFLSEDLEKLKSLELADLNYTCNVKTYWKDFDNVIDPDISLPTLFVRKDARCNWSINIDNQIANPKKLPLTCYHLSWAKPPKYIKSKIESYSHANEIDKEWYNNIYMKNVNTNFAPTNPLDYQSTRLDPLPQEIKSKL